MPVAVFALVVRDGLHRSALFTKKQSLTTRVCETVVLLLPALALFPLTRFFMF